MDILARLEGYEGLLGYRMILKPSHTVPGASQSKAGMRIITFNPDVVFLGATRCCHALD